MLKIKKISVVILLLFLLQNISYSTRLGLIARDSVEECFSEHISLLKFLRKNLDPAFEYKFFSSNFLLRKNLSQQYAYETKPPKFLKKHRLPREFIRSDFPEAQLRRDEPIDLAIISAYDYLKHLKGIVKPIAIVNYQRDFSCVLAIRKDSGIKQISDLKNKHIMFGEKGTLLGDILPRKNMNKKGLTVRDLKDYSFSVLEKNIALSILNNSVDAGVISYHTAKKYLEYNLEILCHTKGHEEFSLPEKILVIRNHRKIDRIKLFKLLYRFSSGSKKIKFSPFSLEKIEWIKEYL
jgi:hypothetical protein